MLREVTIRECSLDTLWAVAFCASNCNSDVHEECDPGGSFSPGTHDSHFDALLLHPFRARDA